jgi:hypothetical protein
MEEKNKKEEIASRRKFLKNVVKAILPILFIASLSSIAPVIAKTTEKEIVPVTCNISCEGIYSIQGSTYECYKIKNGTDKYGNKTGDIVYYNYCGKKLTLIIQYHECERDFTKCETLKTKVTLYPTDQDDEWHDLILADPLTKYSFIKVIKNAD